MLLHSLVLFSFAPVVFYLFPPSLLAPSPFISVRVFFRRVLRGRVKPPFHCPTLFFFVTVTHAGLGNSRGQKSRGTSVQMQKKVKRGRMEGKKQTNNEWWVYLGRGDKGGKEKVFLMGESWSVGRSHSQWQSYLVLFLLRNEKSRWGEWRTTNLWTGGNCICIFVSDGGKWKKQEMS